jgi:hypothetical protein
MRQSSHHRLAHTSPLSSSPLSELDRRHGKPAVENEPITLLKTFGVMVGLSPQNPRWIPVVGGVLLDQVALGMTMCVAA